MSEEKNEVVLDVGKKPDAGSQSVSEYVSLRYEMLQPALGILGSQSPSSSVPGYLELMLKEEFWRLRSMVLENSLREFARRYMAAVEVIDRQHDNNIGPKATELIKEILNDIPEEITKLPTLE